MAMNFSAITPRPNMMINRPVRVTPNGNLYKIPMVHQQENGEQKHFEVWATKEAIQKHFIGQTDAPKEYQMKKFARSMYEQSMRKSNGQMQHQGMLVTTDNVTHGNPKLWPSTLSHPEIKY